MSVRWLTNMPLNLEAVSSLLGSGIAGSALSSLLSLVLQRLLAANADKSASGYGWDKIEIGESLTRLDCTLRHSGRRRGLQNSGLLAWRPRLERDPQLPRIDLREMRTILNADIDRAR
jgi:hypothetical protein